ncbi:aldose epimerase family protein [Caulobacter sp. 1776]|uniref:aldose epimerase family protein n=1 Tax=Caulobacter sp. 1776 TaxID=3156420 RepID=UPI0033928138
MTAIASIAHAAAVERLPFGKTSTGAMVVKTVLRNDLGMRVAAIDYGATLTAIETPDRQGKVANIVLNRPDIASYETNQRRYGAVIGRYAGRITDARFSLDGVTHQLEVGRNNMTLHGGSHGYDKRVWSSWPVTDRRSVGVRFRLLSPAGDQGFPGALRLTVTYRLMRKSNALRIEYVARASAPTVVNFTNHAFFNLAGAGAGTVLDHRVWIDADRYADVDARKAPSGALPSVTGTVMDFRSPRRLGDVLRLDDPLLAPSNGFDHSLVLRDAVADTPRLAGWIEDPASGRRMTVLTTEPSVQFNSGNGFDGGETGSEGVAYPRYSGLAFETQHLPDSPNQPTFPSTALRPGKPFRSTTILRFSR